MTTDRQGEGEQQSVAEVLAQLTGRPVVEFETDDDLEYPDPDDLESVPEEERND